MHLAEPVSLPLPWQITTSKEDPAAKPATEKRWEPLLEPSLADRRMEARISRTWRQVALAVAMVAFVILAAATVVVVGVTAPVYLPLALFAPLLLLTFLLPLASTLKGSIEQYKEKVKLAETLLAQFRKLPTERNTLKQFIINQKLPLSLPTGKSSIEEMAEKIVASFEPDLDKLRITLAHYMQAEAASQTLLQQALQSRLDAADLAGEIPQDRLEREMKDLELSFTAAEQRAVAAFWLALLQRGGEAMPRVEIEIKKEKKHQIQFLTTQTPSLWAVAKRLPDKRYDYFCKCRETVVAATPADLLAMPMQNLVGSILTAISAS